MKQLFCWLAFATAFGAEAQITPSLHLPAGAGKTYSEEPDAFSFLYNVAVLPVHKTGSAGIMAEQRYLLREGNLVSGAAVFVTGLGNFGLNINYEGYTAFKSYDLNLGFGKNLGKVQAGIRFRYATQRISGFEGNSILSAGAGVRVEPVKRWVVAGEWLNYPARAGKGAAPPPRGYKAGLGFSVSENFLWFTEWMQEQDVATAVHSGIVFHYRNNFFASAGISTWNGIFYSSAGWRRKQMRVSLSVSNHPYLGISPAVWMQNQWAK